MKNFVLPVILLVCFAQTFGQNYERNAVCSRDTVDAYYHELKFTRATPYKAFRCSQVSKLGVRFDIAFNTYAYNQKTKNWLGNHNGGQLGLIIVYGDFNIGARFKSATISPKIELVYGGDTLPKTARLNPIKMDYDISYSINVKYNFSIEPYIALTSNSFRVINEDELNKTYPVLKIKALTIGAALNKYFHLKDFEFLALFVRYSYGFANFKKINSDLGLGYHDISFGVAYKAFGTKRFYRRI